MSAKQIQTMMNLHGVLDVPQKNGELISQTATASEQTNLQIRLDGLMSLREESRANLQALSGKGVEVQTKDGCGQIPCESLESYDRDSHCWKTQGELSQSKTEKVLEEYSNPLPKSGMMCNGTLFQLQPLVQGIDGKESGYWLPTPIARDWKDTPGMAKQAGKRQRTDTLPRKIYHIEQSPPKSGIINPKLALWLMGYPQDWLEIN